MLEFALAHWQHIAAAVAAPLLLGWLFWPALSKLPLASWFSRKHETSRLELLAHLDAAYEGFKAIECAEGMAGVRALIPHAYHEHEAHP